MEKVEDNITKDLADKVLEISKSDQLEKFCPIIKGQCRADCVSFYEGQLIKILEIEGVPYYSIDPATCTNVLIDGIVYVEET